MNWAVIIISTIVIGIGLTFAILYLKTLQDILKEIHYMHRTVEPSNVWLMLIPFFNLIYAFILYPKISESIHNHYASQNIFNDDDYGKALALTMAVLNLVSFIPLISSLASLANLIIFIIYWNKMAKIKHNLKTATRIANIKKTYMDKDILDS